MSTDTPSEGPGSPEFDARFRARWRERLRESLPASLTDEQFELFCTEIEAVARAAFQGEPMPPSPLSDAEREAIRARPLRVNGEPIPQGVLDGPVGAFARYCGETDPTVLALLDAEA